MEITFYTFYAFLEISKGKFLFMPLYSQPQKHEKLLYFKF